MSVIANKRKLAESSQKIVKSSQFDQHALAQLLEALEAVITDQTGYETKITFQLVRRLA